MWLRSAATGGAVVLGYFDSISQAYVVGINPNSSMVQLRLAGLSEVFNVGGDAQIQAMTIVPNGSAGLVGIGTADPCASAGTPSNCLLSVAGAIQAKEVVVSTGWSDYVFSPDYHPASLSEVAAYIKENHHLPDIPSAKDVAEKGVGLGDMQAKLLAKIEELTLHMIEVQKQNLELQKRIARLEAGGGTNAGH